ncbi:MAG: hypothetical protein HYX68_00415 [Planctomycetes bacterium]|nr:hypothetical protein [Planctomycetota bacterium]
MRETFTTTRKAYKMECRTEAYSTFRCERVPVCKDVTVTVMKRVPVWTEQERKVCCNVTVYEDRVVNKTTHKYVQQTVMKKQLVRLGHWECREVQPIFSGFGGGLGGGILGGHGHHGCRDNCGKACGNPCPTTNACDNACRPARTRKVWVRCPEYKECPVTVCKKVCVTEPVKCKVAVCKQEWKVTKVKVCTMQCVAEKVVRKCTVWETRKVECKGTRTVRVCVPYDQTVTCTKLVPKTVTRQVPCTPARADACSNACTTSRDCCESRLRGFFRNAGHRLRCNADCGSSCRSSSCCK